MKIRAMSRRFRPAEFAAGQVLRMHAKPPAINIIVGRLACADAYNDVHCSSSPIRNRQDTSVGPSTGRFDVGAERVVASPIRGRADKLKAIAASVTAVARARGEVLVIEGRPGIGKSRLLTEVMALAGKCGVRTLFGQAFEYQQTVPFFSLFMARPPTAFR
jgi:hypothetical protein